MTEDVVYGEQSPTMENIDPRPLYRDALAWVRALAAAVPADRLTDPTPCPEWDVRGMLGHLVATVDRARVIGEGGDPQQEPRVVTGVPDDGWADALAAAEDKTARPGPTTPCSTCSSRFPGVGFPAGRRCGGTSAKPSSTAGISPWPPVRTARPIPPPPRRCWR